MYMYLVSFLCVYVHVYLIFLTADQLEREFVKLIQARGSV